jgi:membrane protein implicated in regulation of membrane protease activity
LVIPHLTGWLQFGGITLVIGFLSVAVHAHVAGGALVTVGLSPNRTTLRTLATVVAVAAVILGILAILSSSAFQPPSKATRSTRPHAASEVSGQAVVEAFFTAISDHNWPRVWHLGGENLGTGIYRTYTGMISGYRCTKRDVLDASPTTSGEVVSGSFLAYEADGTKKAVQRFAFRYVVRRGVIASGHAYLVGGSPPPGC